MFFKRKSADAQSQSTASPMAIADIDPAALMRIKNLQIRAKLIVEGFFNGLHRSPMHGASVEFSEYRAYSPGDDPRGLDWKLFARTDRYYIKKFEDETNRRCYLVLDQSRSMGYGSLEYTKIDYARTLAATLAYFLTLQRDHVGLMTFDELIGDVIDARSRTGHLRQIMAALSRDVSGAATDLRTPLSQVAALTRRRGLVVLISDLLTPPDDLRQSLGLLRSRQHEVVLLRILDPAEKQLQLDSPEGITDMESGQLIHIDPVAARQSYREDFEAHADEIQTICDAVGVSLYELVTDRPLQDALSQFVLAHQRRGSVAGRRMAK